MTPILPIIFTDDCIYGTLRIHEIAQKKFRQRSLSENLYNKAFDYPNYLKDMQSVEDPKGKKLSRILSDSFPEGYPGIDICQLFPNAFV